MIIFPGSIIQKCFCFKIADFLLSLSSYVWSLPNFEDPFFFILLFCDIIQYTINFFNHFHFNDRSREDDHCWRCWWSIHMGCYLSIWYHKVSNAGIYFCWSFFFNFLTYFFLYFSRLTCFRPPTRKGSLIYRFQCRCFFVVVVFLIFYFFHFEYFFFYLNLSYVCFILLL